MKKEKKGSKSLIYKYFFEETKDVKIQFFRYLFVGGFAAVVNIGSLYVLTEWLHIYYLIASVIGFIAGLLVNYFLSKRLVFAKEKGCNPWLEFASYAGVGVVGLGLDTLFMWLLSDKLGVYYMISKIISTGLVFIWNFGGRKILYIITERTQKNAEKSE